MSDKIKIAVSSCLLGNPVRYDGCDKRDENILRHLQTDFELIPVCPEVNAGLGVPRPKIQLVSVSEELRALGVDDRELDVTVALLDAAEQFLLNSPGICGLVIKSRSPSCGYGSTTIFYSGNTPLTTGNGLFTAYVLNNRPGLPIVEETTLLNTENMQDFIRQVSEYSLRNV